MELIIVKNKLTYYVEDILVLVYIGVKVLDKVVKNCNHAYGK